MTSHNKDYIIVIELLPVTIRQVKRVVTLMNGCCCWHGLVPCLCQRPVVAVADHHPYGMSPLIWKMAGRIAVPCLEGSSPVASADRVVVAQSLDYF